MKSKKINKHLKFKIFIVKLILFLGQNTILGRGLIRKSLINLINLIIPTNDPQLSRFICYVRGVPFNFYNDRLTGIKIYFGRNETKEIDFIKKNSTNNSTFIDIGANMGLYTLNIASLINKNNKIKIIAIEPNPINCNRLKANIKLLKKKISFIDELVKIKSCAVSDGNRKKFLNFGKGLANGYISNNKKNNSIFIECKTLHNIVKEENLKYITNLKIDILIF